MKLTHLINEFKVFKWTGSTQGKIGQRHLCHKNSRQYYFKHKNRGVKYCEGKVCVAMEFNNFKWIDHAWNIKGNDVIDITYGPNNYQYIGNIIKDDWMIKIPNWYLENMRRHNATNPKDSFNLITAHIDMNIRVCDEFGKKVFE